MKLLLPSDYQGKSAKNHRAIDWEPAATRRILPFFFFALVILLAFWKPLFHSEFTLLTGGDMCSQSYPWFSVAAYWLKKGTFLLWDPYVYSGKANLGELQPGVLYPLNWIAELVPAAEGTINLEAMQGLIVAHYFLAGVFCFFLARSFQLSGLASALAGVVFALGGYTTQIYGFVNIFCGFVWMPLIVLLFRRALLATHFKLRVRWMAACSATLGLALLAGHHVPPIHTGLFLLLYALYVTLQDWKRMASTQKWAIWATLGGTGVMACLFTAVQWLPSAEWARGVWRWAGEGDPIRWGERIPYSVLQTTGNVSPQSALSLVLPYSGPDANLYIGITVLFLAAVGWLFVTKPDARFFGAAAVFYFLASWGQFSAIHGWANTFVPGLWFAREVFHYLIPFQLCIALVAASGFDYLLQAYERRADIPLRVFVRHAGWALGFVVLAAGILIAGANLWAGISSSDPRLRRIAMLAVYSALLGLLLFLLHTGRISAARCGVLMLLVTVVDLTSQFSRDVRTTDRPRGKPDPAVQAYWKTSEISEYLSSHRAQEIFRIDDPQGILPPNFGDAWRLESTMGHGATASVRYLDFRNTGWGPGSNASALLNARYLLSRVTVPWLEKVMPGGDAAIYRNPRAVPRVFVAGRYRAMADDAETLRLLPTPLMAPRETVFLNRAEVDKCPQGFLAQVQDEGQGFEIRDVAYRTAAEKEAEQLGDESARAQLHLYKPPWGWSTGDDLAIRFRPKRARIRSYLIIGFFPSRQTSHLTVHLERSGQAVDVPVELSQSEAGVVDNSVRHFTLDLGVLEPEEYRIGVTKTAECSARLDSLRIADAVSERDVTDPGEVAITSLRPNRIRMEAQLPRASFVVISEMMYPGWEALIDGQSAPVLMGDYTLRAIPVPAGKHRIVLRFRSKTFLWGLCLSVGSLILCCWFGMRRGT